MTETTGTSHPSGDVYDWYVRGRELLRSGNPAAAAALLSRASAAEPASRQLREALGRAQYASGDYPGARANFDLLVEADPADDYARFGLGISALRTGDVGLAVASLTLAVAMRPDNADYSRALTRARATAGRR